MESLRIKHSPEPWITDLYEVGSKEIMAGEAKMDIAYTSGVWPEEEDTGNAVLITKAPEMYNLLLRLDEHHQLYGTVPGDNQLAGSMAWADVIKERRSLHAEIGDLIEQIYKDCTDHT